MKQYIVSVEGLRSNVKVCRQIVGDKKIYAVVKGNGYGLEIGPFAKLLREEGVTAFAVTEVFETRALRDLGMVEEEILMLRPTEDAAELGELVNMSVVCTVDSAETAMALDAAAERAGTVAMCHIKIDVGMGRYGFEPGEIEKIKAVYSNMQKVAVTGIYTHFPSAFSDKKGTRAQFDTFMQVVEQLRAAGLETGCVHCANSSAALRFDYTRLDAVRLGSALLGRLSFRAKKNLGLEKIGYMEAEVRDVRWLPAGRSVGYGSVFTTKKPTRVAILDAGYYHGFCAEKGRDTFRFKDCAVGCLSLIKRWIFGQKIYVTINGKKARVLGHVGMLHTVADVTDIPCEGRDVARLEVNPLMAKGVRRLYR